MKQPLTKLPLLASLLVSARLCTAQSLAPETTRAAESLDLSSNGADSPNRIGLTYRMGMNITVDFQKLGGFQPLSRPGPATGANHNRTYDNGYNRVAMSTNA